MRHKIKVNGCVTNVSAWRNIDILIKGVFVSNMEKKENKLNK